MNLMNINTSTTIQGWQTFLAGSSYTVIYESGICMVRNVITYTNNNETWQQKIKMVVTNCQKWKWL